MEGSMTQRHGIIGRFIQFLKEHKFYWLLPLVILLLIVAALVALGALGGDSLSPFMYADS